MNDSQFRFDEAVAESVGQLLDAFGFAICVRDVTGRCRFANRTFTSLRGTDVLGIDPEIDTRVLSTGVAETVDAHLDAGTGSRPIRVRRVRVDMAGERRVAWLFRPDDEPGASAALRDSNERFRLAFQLAPIGMVLFEPKGTVAEVNRAFAAMIGSTPEELAGRGYLDLMPSDQVNAALLDADHVARKDGHGIEAERLLQHRDGRTVVTRAIGASLLDAQGRQVGYLGLFEDVTAGKEAAELRQRLLHADRLAAIGQLAAGVTHEINNPSAVVMGNLELLRATLIGANGPRVFSAADMAEMGRAIEDSLDAIRRIGAIVRGLRTFARIEAERVETLQINDIVEIAVNLTRNEIRHRARLVRRVGELPLISGDPGKLAQVVTNLLVNAAQAIDTNRGHDEIRVSTGLDGAHVVISVEDTGHGIRPEHLPHIFEPFFTTKPKDVGTGLGLSLSAEIIKLHHGEIRVWSDVGVGTRFEVRLPCDTGLEPPAPTPRSTERSVTPRRRILAIDDEPMLLDVVRLMLEPKHVVVTAEGGRRAIDLLEHDRSFDVIVCDVMMPVVDGPAVYGFLRSRAPDLVSRLVFCTGGAFTRRARALLGESSAPILEKPFTPEQLDNAIAAVTRTGSA